MAHDNTNHKRRSKNKRHRRNETDVSHICQSDEQHHGSGLSDETLLSLDFSNMSSDMLSKIQSEILNLKSHLTFSQAQLAVLSEENVHFKKEMSQYKKKIDKLNNVAFASQSDDGPSSSTKETKSRKRSRKSRNKKIPHTVVSGETPTKSATQNYQDKKEDNDEDEEM